MDSGFLKDYTSIALQDILTRKEEEKRKALLDSIAQQNADTNRMQAEGEIEWRKAQSKREEAIANKERLNDYARGQKLGDEDKAWMKQAGYGGLIQSTPTGEFEPFAKEADGSISEGPIQQTEDTYAGSPQEQKDARQTEALKGLMSNETFTKGTPVQQYLMLRELGITNIDPSKLREPEDEQIPYVWIDRQGNPHEKGKFPKGTHFANQPAPAGTGSTGVESYTLVDDDNNPETPPMAFGNKTRTLYPLKGKDGVEVPSTLRKVGTTTPQPKPTVEQWRTALPAIRKAVEARGKAKGLRTDQMALLDSNIAAARATAINMYDTTQISPAFRSQLLALVTNPVTSNLPVERLVVGLNKQRTEKLGQAPLSEEEMQVMRTILPPILGH